MYKLKSELDEKNIIIKQYERQISEIPILECEIEELRNKLQKCIDDFKIDKDLLIRLQEELEAYVIIIVKIFLKSLSRIIIIIINNFQVSDKMSRPGRIDIGLSNGIHTITIR